MTRYWLGLIAALGIGFGLGLGVGQSLPSGPKEDRVAVRISGTNAIGTERQLSNPPTPATQLQDMASGKLATSVRVVPDFFLAEFVEPGSRVDILLWKRLSDGSEQRKLVVENVLVLVGGCREESPRKLDVAHDQPFIATLALTPKQIDAVTEATMEGTLTLGRSSQESSKTPP